MIEHLKVLCTKSWNKRLKCIDWWQKLFWCANKNKEEAYEKTIEMSKNNDYTIGSLLDYKYFSNHYKLISIGLSK